MMLSLIIVMLFFAVHFASRRLEVASRAVSARIFSAAGGVSAAYVFVHLVPELRRREPDALRVLPWLPEDTAIYYLALAGLVVFFGVERMVVRAEAETDTGPARSDVPLPLFWLHIGIFAIYSFVIGHLLVEEDDRHPVEFILFGLALALHFMVSDHALRRLHSQLHARHGRLVLAIAVLAGWAAGLAGMLPPSVSAVLFALLAGGIVFNVIKEELPPDGDGSFAAFVAGAAAYVLLLSLADRFA